MRVETLLVTAANDRSYADLISEACQAARPTQVRAAIAYATHSGVGELCQVMDAIPAWRSARKQWLVGIGYCRSDPKALEHLDGLSQSCVRIHDGQFVCGRQGCTPRVSYHPKLYMRRGSSPTSRQTAMSRDPRASVLERLVDGTTQSTIRVVRLMFTLPMVFGIADENRIELEAPCIR